VEKGGGGKKGSEGENWVPVRRRFQKAGQAIKEPKLHIRGKEKGPGP